MRFFPTISTIFLCGAGYSFSADQTAGLFYIGQFWKTFRTDQPAGWQEIITDGTAGRVEQVQERGQASPQPPGELMF